MKYLITLVSCLALSGCAQAQSQSIEGQDQLSDPVALTSTSGPQAPFQAARSDGLQDLIIAGGCFWCVESDYEKLTGVVEAVSGYTGGSLDNPTYKKVGTNRTGHYEAVKVTFDPAVVSYRQLIDHFWTTVDPTDASGQFCDKGESYRTAIFVTPDQRADAEGSLERITDTKPFSADIVTPILPAVTFYDAEDYHQDYYKKNPVRYKYYRNGCKRDKRLKQLWG